MDTLLLLRVAYYAAELIQPCVVNRPFAPLGGRAGLDKQSLFVALTGIGDALANEVYNSTVLNQLGTGGANSEA